MYKSGLDGVSNTSLALVSRYCIRYAAAGTGVRLSPQDHQTTIIFSLLKECMHL
jgi:hypothetical protein